MLSRRLKPFVFLMAIVLVLTIALISGCAGPASPIGAIPQTDPDQVKFKASDFFMPTPEKLAKIMQPRIEFSPKRQVLHDSSDIKILVQDPLGIAANYKIRVFHNGYDVSDAFNASVKKVLSSDEHKLQLAISNVRFQASEDNQIDVYYFRDNSKEVSARASLESPVCRPFSNNLVTSTGKFKVPERLIWMIQRSAKQAGFNPGFIAGLVAQESGFNNLSVSWAKALGITQITSSAEPAVLAKFPEFPRYPGINDLGFLELKLLIASGKMNGGNEWRLDDERSIQGGLAYLESVKNFWYAPENFNLVKSSFSDPEIGLAKVILASYQSGNWRVKRALVEYGANWLHDEELFEAKKYINKIFSFCYHFSEGEKDAKNENAS